MNTVTWVLESEVFPETHAPLRQAIVARKQRLVDWFDHWWIDGIPTDIASSPVVFHGSLGNAARITEALDWRPGPMCPVQAFHCSSWYELARPWLVHTDWVICTAADLIAKRKAISERFGMTSRIFIRPDSPLKHFSGRVVDIDSLSLASLDHGFYYEDENIPVVAAPIQRIGREWRFVIVDRSVIAGSAYDPEKRKPIRAHLDSAAASFASMVAAELLPPARVYVLDVCEGERGLRLLELNPFGGADLYACDADAIVDHLSAVAIE